MHRKLYDRLRNTPVYKRLWISTVTVAVIPTVLISMLLLLIFRNTFTERIAEYSGNLTMQMGSYVELQVRQLNIDIANFSATRSTLDFLREYPYMTRSERYVALGDVRTAVSGQFGKLGAVSDILLLTNDLRSVIHVYGGTEKSLATAREKVDSIIGALGKPGAGTVYDTLYAPDASENGGLVVAKRIVDGSSGIIRGYIIVHMRESFLSSFYESWDLEKSGDLYILDAGGRIMSSSDRSSVGGRFPEETALRVKAGHGALSGAVGPGGPERYMMVFAALETPPLSVVCLIPRNYLTDDMLSIGMVVLLVAAVLGISSSGVSSLIMNSITRPISELIRRMHRVQNNQLVVGEPDPHADELATMNNTFDQTVRRLQESIEEIKRAEKGRTNLELKALTAQISPHFLTNTLNTIRTLAHIQNAGNVESMVASLINILAARLGKTDALVPLSEETALLEDYINLQKYRCFNDIAFEISVDEAAKDCLIPVFTLQPLVENALRHGGLDARMDGQIVVKAYRMGESVHIFVTDNGAGMSRERLEAVMNLRSQSPAASSDHIGVQNVHQRIRLLFGEPYGLAFTSEESLFTEADILLPYTTKSPGGNSGERSPS